MNNKEILAKNLGVKVTQIEAVLNLLSEGATIPFIARYRKEVTGSLDEEQIRVIEKEYTYLENLLKRKALPTRTMIMKKVQQLISI